MLASKVMDNSIKTLREPNAGSSFHLSFIPSNILLDQRESVASSQQQLYLALVHYVLSEA